MTANDDLALAWANGFCHGMEYLALTFQARLDGGQDAAGAVLSGEAEGLVFVEQLIANGQDRGQVVDLFRQKRGLSYGQDASD